MGILAKILPRTRPVETHKGYKTFTEYTPAFSPWDASAYEQALCRACIERFAQACSKLTPEILGDNEACNPKIRKLVESWPNPDMNWSNFLKRLATITEADTTAYVIPGLDSNLETTSLWPLRPASAEVLEYKGEPWIKFYLPTGDVMAIELRRVAIITRFQYASDLFGGGNGPLKPTLSLLNYQTQAQESAVKNSARIRFIGKTTGLMHEEDMEKKRQRFYERNLSASNESGLLMYDNTWENITQINEQHFTIDADEMTRINNQLFSYFGINEGILQNKYTEEDFGAWYEGKVEPWAIQTSEAMTKALYTVTQRRHGNGIMFSASALSYASNSSKRNMIRDMTDRGIMTVNEARKVLQLPPVPGGDVLPIRGEYRLNPASGSISETDFDLGGDDQEYADTDSRGDKESDE